MSNTENFEYEYVYHIYSHANGRDLIFREEENYKYFLDKLVKYIVPIAEIYAYCLMPNHFHLLVRFKSEDQIPNEDEHKYLMKQFSNLLNGYAKAYNKRYNRKGSLFLDYLKRKRVNDSEYLIKLFHYIHNNPVNHGFVEDIKDWKYSSYHSYINLAKESKIERTEMMQYFDTVNDFIEYHQSNVEYDFLTIK
ncbi:REP element-mobilizing transposase RayT [Chryseobacterium oranimense]|uniref:REP element-mobilizing transposase RayT n=1 Tax=Chryseobacterium oranimense TaxID=421058 RepID=A0A1M5NHY2_9FLAO|nr:transposase [Chryseobacterium oranimense]SHG89138.1 REP element-mobilizing transposase RayT [Chryseobacterium oranimense]